jgi:predicted dehydrogenase
VKQLKFGVIGAGGRGYIAKFAHQLEKGSQIVAVADTNAEVLKTCQENYGQQVFQTRDWREVLNVPTLDGVFICTPDFQHEEQALACLEKGLAVYLEKPMAITIAGCDRLLEAARKHKAKLFIGHNMRYMNFTCTMKDIIAAGTIGEVKAIWCRHFIAYGGDAYFKDWHSEAKNTTGLLLQKGAHDLDVIHWLADSYSTRVTAFGQLSVYDKCEKRDETVPGDKRFNETHWPPLEQKGFSPKIDIEDHSMVLMQLANGVQASYMQCHYTPDTCRNYTVIGTQGRLENVGDYGEDTKIHVYTKRTTQQNRPDIIHQFPKMLGEGHGGSDVKIVAEFIEHVRQGSPTVTSPVAARYSVATGCQATASLRSGGTPMDVPPLEPGLRKYFE